MRALLIRLRIIQVISNEERHKKGLKKLGHGYSKAYRFNPYNPLSYIAFMIILIGAILMFGFVGFRKEMETLNLFKWS